MRRTSLPACAWGGVLVLILSASLARAAPNTARLVSVESSTPVFDVLYKYGQVTAGPGGAYGANVTASQRAWFIEEQRAGGVDVIDGVLRHDPSLIAAGLKIFHFGLAREAANGSFPGSAWPFHGTALFLAEAAPALLILQSSSYASAYRGELTWQIGQMRRAATHLVSTVGGPGKIDDRTKNHRYFEAAMALGGVGVLAQDATLRKWSKRYAWEGIQMQRPDGVMPEDGGHDSGYQAMGLINASRYLVLLATGNLYHSLYSAVQKGEAWEVSRVDANGQVNQSGDTRTAGCQEHSPAGGCKTVFYAPIFNALAHWAAISGDGRYERASYAVWLHSGYGGH